MHITDKVLRYVILCLVLYLLVTNVYHVMLVTCAKFVFAYYMPMPSLPSVIPVPGIVLCSSWLLDSFECCYYNPG